MSRSHPAGSSLRPAGSALRPAVSVPLAEAKNHLSALVARVERGEEVSISRQGVQVVISPVGVLVEHGDPDSSEW